MAKRQQSRSMTKEASGTRGRSNPNKISSKSSNNRRTAARVADNPDEQMQSAMPSDSAGRSRTGKPRSGARSKKTASKTKAKPTRTRSAR
jgi:hypothetical protein